MQQGLGIGKGQKFSYKPKPIDPSEDKSKGKDRVESIVQLGSDKKVQIAAEALDDIELPGFPEKIIDKFRVVYPYTDANKKQLVATVAKRLASLYAKYLTEEGGLPREKRILYSFPASSTVELFKGYVAKKLIEKLANTFATLDTGFYNDALGVACHWCHINSDYFPKSQTGIWVKNGELLINMNLKE